MKVTESTQKTLSEVRSGTNINFCYPQLLIVPSQDPISVANIVIQLSDDDDISSGLVLSSKKKASNATCIKDYLGMLSSADNPTPVGRSGSFVSFGSSKVQVEFEIVGRRLRRCVLESVTKERHGVEGVRILRLLLDTGKMDEKQVG